MKDQEFVVFHSKVAEAVKIAAKKRRCAEPAPRRPPTKPGRRQIRSKEGVLLVGGAEELPQQRRERADQGSRPACPTSCASSSRPTGVGWGTSQPFLDVLVREDLALDEILQELHDQQVLVPGHLDRGFCWVYHET